MLIKAPKVELDREGNPVTLTYTAEDGTKKYIYNYTSNPAFKPLTELILAPGPVDERPGHDGAGER